MTRWSTRSCCRMRWPDSRRRSGNGIIGSEVPVTLLGHIFEQSVTDIERLKARATGEAPPEVTKRKREGVVYTPDMVTRFLVEKPSADARASAEAALSRGMGLARRPRRRRKQIAFWRDSGRALRTSRSSIPPAAPAPSWWRPMTRCFSSIARAEKALAALGGADRFRRLSTKSFEQNLYGVDLNPELVEITRLSLWLKTARREHRLASLEATIRVGDSLIEDAAFTLRPFDWRAAFPDVFARGGFDVVIGNPPYVRMELIKAVKPYLAEHYAVASDRADLYAYFFERGFSLLREGGRLGFISSSTFFRTGSGEPLRRLLSEARRIETIVDFGDAQIFGGVTTYPAIVTLPRGSFARGELDYLVVDGEPPSDFGRVLAERARKCLGAADGAILAGRGRRAVAAARQDRQGARRSARSAARRSMGFKTGLNEAFVIDTPTRDRLVRTKQIRRTAETVSARRDAKRWRVEPEGLWLINNEHEGIAGGRYRRYLNPAIPRLACVKAPCQIQARELE